MELRLNSRTGLIYAHDLWHACAELREHFSGDYRRCMRTPRSEWEYIIPRSLLAKEASSQSVAQPPASLRATATPPLQTSASASSNATSAAGAAAIEYCKRRRAELGVPDSYTGSIPKPKTPEEQWASDPALRAEFVEFEYFAAYQRMEQAGRIRVAGKPQSLSATPVKAASDAAKGLKLEEDVVAWWHRDVGLRAELGSLEEYAALRRHVADPSNPAPPRVSQERLRLERAREEDRAANVDPQLPVEERARLVWKASEAIRWEFRGDLRSFVAYRRHLEKRR